MEEDHRDNNGNDYGVIVRFMMEDRRDNGRNYFIYLWNPKVYTNVQSNLIEDEKPTAFRFSTRKQFISCWFSSQVKADHD